VPIPPVFLGEDQYGAYVVLDGRQRLTAINEFLKNTYQLKNLEIWKDLNGLTFNDLQKKKLDRAITRRFVPAVVILKESSPQVKYDVFDRLNTGGVIAAGHSDDVDQSFRFDADQIGAKRRRPLPV
jgi:hypothetical protein